MMFGKSDMKTAPASGMETMLRAMGMGDIIDMAKAMATQGTFDKIVEFADKADQMLVIMQRIEGKLDAIQSEAGKSHTVSDAVAGGVRGAEVEPGAGADDGGHGGPAERSIPRMLATG